MDKLRAIFSPSRVAVYLTTGAGAATAAAAVLETAGDTQSTIGLLVAYGGAVGAVIKWLDGRSKWEQAQAEAEKAVLAAVDDEKRSAEAAPAEATDVPAGSI